MTYVGRLVGCALVSWCLGAGLAIGAEASLVEATRRGDVAAVRAQIERGVDVNAATPDGTTALHWAAYENEVEIARLLVRAGADAQAANRYGMRPLSLAAADGHAEIVRLLLAAGADPHTVTSEGETALMLAARSGVVDAVDALIAGGANVNARETWRGQTALMWAAAEGNTAAVRALVRAGADVRAKSKAGFTPLLFAAREGRLETAGVLLDLGSSLDETLSINSNESAGGVEQGQQEASLDAFLLASGNAHFELAAYLVKRGANPNVAPRGWTALHQVSWVRKMGEAGSSSPPPQGSGGMTSLGFVKFLAERGADVNAKATVRRLPAGSSRLNYIGATPFFMAARTADIDLMRLLLDLGAEPLVPAKSGTTPLMVAAGVGSSLPGEEAGTDAEAMEAVKMLLALGGDVNAVDTGGDTAMHGAAYKHLPGVAQLLGDSGAKVEIWNQKNKAGWTPVDIATGIQRGMNFVFSFDTEAVLLGLLARAGVAANQR